MGTVVPFMMHFTDSLLYFDLNKTAKFGSRGGGVASHSFFSAGLG